LAQIFSRANKIQENAMNKKLKKIDIQHLKNLYYKLPKSSKERKWEVITPSCCPDMAGIITEDHSTKVCSEQSTKNFLHQLDAKEAEFICELKNKFLSLVEMIEDKDFRDPDFESIEEIVEFLENKIDYNTASVDVLKYIIKSLELQIPVPAFYIYDQSTNSPKHHISLSWESIDSQFDISIDTEADNARVHWSWTCKITKDYTGGIFELPSALPEQSQMFNSRYVMQQECDRLLISKLKQTILCINSPKCYLCGFEQKDMQKSICESCNLQIKTAILSR
jgi:hypothetical protein